VDPTLRSRLRENVEELRAPGWLTLECPGSVRLFPSRTGGGKAIIAVARKFLGIIYRASKNDWELMDVLNFVLIERYKHLSGGDNSS
jgi:hypothetical protein